MIQEVARVPKYELTHDVQQCVVLVALPGAKEWEGVRPGCLRGAAAAARARL
eukprot:COSAG01_NODE_5075_length_4505_cov_5.572174_2_plen_52_part_00